MTAANQLLLGCIVILGLGLVAGGCAVVLPPGFPHRAHLTEERCGGPGQPECPTCASCHQDVRADQPSTPPSIATCSQCHRDDAARVLDLVRPATQKRTPITFSHRQHDALVRGQCVGCHAGIVSDGASGAIYPAMATCIDCHDEGLEAQSCTSCHPRAELRALVPESFLRHDGSFYRNHGTMAVQREAVCEQCHAERDCVRCHDQSQPIGLARLLPEAIEAELIHRGDFVARHAIEAASQRGTCARCHTPSFCDSCHIQRGVSGNRAGALNPHPIGWIGDPGGAAFHGRAARRDILACASCHDAGPATNCIRCHAVGGPGGNPHPRGWSSFRSPDAPMCRYCHVP